MQTCRKLVISVNLWHSIAFSVQAYVLFKYDYVSLQTENLCSYLYTQICISFEVMLSGVSFDASENHMTQLLAARKVQTLLTVQSLRNVPKICCFCST